MPNPPTPQNDLPSPPPSATPSTTPRAPRLWRTDAPLAILVAVAAILLPLAITLAAAWTNRAVLPGTHPSDWLPGLAILAILGVLVLGVTARYTRDRLRAALAVLSALRAHAAGDHAPRSLALPTPATGSPDPIADAWNQILARRESARAADLNARLDAHLAPTSAPAAVDADLTLACDVFWQGLVLVDHQLRVKYLNGAAAAFLAVLRDSASGQTAEQINLDPRVLDAIRATVSGSARGRSVIEIGTTTSASSAPSTPASTPQLAAPDRRGQRSAPGVLRFSVRPVRREDKASALVLIEDVTQQRVADHARNAFVAQATHELRTPLTNIRLYLEQLIDDGEHLEPLARANALNVVSQESRRLERIVGDMLSVSEIEAGTLRLQQGEVRLASLLDDLKADFQAQAHAKNITLSWDISPRLPVLKGDRDKLTLAVHNLLGNAIKYTPQGGKVAVRVDTANGSALLEFSDTGIGIDPAEHHLIFDRFYRAKDQRLADITGSGLGLALAREVVRMHGGDITVHSALNQGSTFSISLPLPAIERTAAAA
jgi:signal transduction histidine kinase